MTIRRIVFVFLWGICSFCSTSYATDTPAPLQPLVNAGNLTTKKHVLIIYSANARHEVILRDALFSRIENEKIPSKDRPEIFEEFIDIGRTRFNPADFDSAFAQYLQQKYANVKLDLVVGHVPEAINFLANHPELFPNVSRYMLASNRPSSPQNAATNSTFFNTEKENVFNAILQVFPRTERIIVVKTKIKAASVDWADTNNLNLKRKIEIELWDDFSFAELYENAKQLPAHTVILFLHVVIDNKGERAVEDVLTKLTQIASVPVFVHVDINLQKPGAMAVGGYIFSNKQLGDFLGRKLLDEEMPETLEALQKQLYGYYFNDLALKHWQIPDKNLPEGSIVLGREESIFYTYRWYLAATLFVIFSELTLIAWLTRSLRHRKIIEAALAEERNLLEVHVEKRTCELGERTEQLEEAQVLFQDAANVAKLGVFNYDLMTKKLSWDAPMFAIYGIAGFDCNFSGCNSFECHSKNCQTSLRDEWQKATHPEDIKKVEAALQVAIKENSEFNINFRIQRSDEKIRTIHALGRVYCDENGKPLRVVGINQDITEREELEAHLAKSKSEFIANMSHDIRTPINGIIGLSKIVLEKEMPTEIRYYLDKIYSSSNVLLDLLNNILDFSKLEADGYQLDSSNFNLRQTLENIGHIFIDKAKEQSVNFVINIAPDVPDELRGDTTKLQQILINLLSNAKKFTKQGEIVTTIELKDIVNNTAKLHFTVRDTGIGMIAKQLEKLFQPFSQADSSITRKYGGTGLGLFISKKFVELMGGEIHVESVFGQGTAFTFEIPFTINAENNTQAIANTSAQHFNAQRILLVDDNEINQIVAEELLTTLGLDVTISSNGKEAVALILTEKFDLVLMDVQMPIMDGLTATRLIRTYPSFEKLPIIAMTANGMQGDSEKSLAAGMNGHLTKPIEVEKVVAELARWLKVEDALPNIATTTINCLPESLPPFDLTRALMLINNNQTLLYKLLLSFHECYFDAANQLTNLINAKDFLQAEHLAHSINGVAGTLAAHRLKNAAATFEKTLNYKQYEEIDELLNALTIELKVAIDATASLLLLPNQIEKENLSETELNQLFEQLKLALSRNDFRAVDIFSKLKPHLEVGDLQHVVVELSNWIDKLDFRQASLILNEVSWNKGASNNYIFRHLQ